MTRYTVEVRAISQGGQIRYVNVEVEAPEERRAGREAIAQVMTATEGKMRHLKVIDVRPS